MIWCGWWVTAFVWVFWFGVFNEWWVFVGFHCLFDGRMFGYYWQFDGNLEICLMIDYYIFFV